MSSRSKRQHQSIRLNSRATNVNKRPSRNKPGPRKRLTVRASHYTKEHRGIESIETRLKSIEMDPTQQRSDHPITLMNKRLQECRETSLYSVNRSGNSNRSPSPYEGLGLVVSKLFGGSYTDLSKFKGNHKDLKTSSGRYAVTSLKENCRKLEAQLSNLELDRSKTESPGLKSPSGVTDQQLVVSADPRSHLIPASQEDQPNKTTTARPCKGGQQKPRQASLQPIRSNICSRKVSLCKSRSSTDSQPRAVFSNEEFTRSRIQRRRDDSGSPSLKLSGKHEDGNNAPLTLRERHARVIHRPPLYQLNIKYNKHLPQQDKLCSYLQQVSSVVSSSGHVSKNGNAYTDENPRRHGKKQVTNQPAKSKMKALRKPHNPATSFDANKPPLLKQIPKQRSRSPKHIVVSMKTRSPVSNEDSLNPEDEQTQPSSEKNEKENPESPHGFRKSFTVGRRNLSRDTISSSNRSSPRIIERVSRAFQSSASRLYRAKEIKQKKETNALPYRDYGSSTHGRLPRIPHPYDELVRRLTLRSAVKSAAVRVQSVTSDPSTPKENTGPLEDDEENEEINKHGEGRASCSTVTDMLKERHQKAMENMARQTELPVLMTSLQRAGHFNWNYDSFSRTTYDNDAIRQGRKKGLEQLYYLMARQPPNKLLER